MKQKYSCDLTIGEVVKDEVFLVKEVKGKDETNTFLLLSDSKGMIPASVPNEIANAMEELETSVVKVDGVVIPDGSVPILRLKQMQMCEDFVPVEIMGGLSKEKVQEYIAEIRKLQAMVTKPGLKELLSVCLTDELLQKMAELPATLALYGKYPGGALSATVSVSRMVIASMKSYVMLGNGFSTGQPNWHVLATASLLFMIGTVTFFEKKDGKTVKSRKGMTTGYYSCLQEALDFAKSKVEMDEDDYSLLLNVLHVSVSDKTEIAAVSKDGIVLRNTIKMYGECDSMDWEIATHQDEKDLYYSQKMKRFILKH